MKKLSIIIPVYNASQFLKNCLDSIFNQDLGKESYEVILVNDSSTDNSKDIINQYMLFNPNIVFLNNENNIGASASRNEALKIAKGDYITFIDADDEIYPNSLQPILQKLIVLDLDILYPEIHFIIDDKVEKIETIGDDKIVKKGVLHNRRTYAATFYKKELVHNTFFDEEIQFGEDTIFNTIVQSRAKRVSCISLPYYKYFNRENSLTKKGFSEKNYQSIYKSISVLEDEKLSFQNRNKDSDRYFEKVQKIFVLRISEMFIIRDLDKEKYNELIFFLDSRNLKFLLQDLDEKYPFFSKSWVLFFFYQKYLHTKSLVYHIFFK